MIGNFTERSGSSDAARLSRSETADGGSARPARRMGGGGGGGIGDAPRASTVTEGGRAGDIGGGEARIWISSVALPLPLSTFGSGFSSPSTSEVTLAAFSEATVLIEL